MGDEVGLEFEPYARTGPVTWPVDAELTEFHRRLIALRNAHDLGSPGLTLLENDSAEQCLSYSRPGGSFPLVCLFNFGPDAEIVVDVQTQGSSTAEDVWSGGTTAVRDAQVSLRLDQHAFALLRLGP